VIDSPTARPRPIPPPSLHLRALDHLRFIRETMEGAAVFTAVSGLGQILVGFKAIVAAYVASQQATPSRWLTVWLIEGFIGFAATAASVVWKAKHRDLELFSRPGKRFALGLFPPLIAGAILTPALFAAGNFAILPSLWLLVYGAGVVSGGAFSVRIVPVMGVAFMILGAATFLAPATWGDLFMALGFGAVHVIFGVLIAWRHGG
jgi:hypothetical protein